jgi:hypothetical protein
MWNMGTDPIYIPANFGDDTFKPEKVVHEKPDKKLTGRIRIIRTRWQTAGCLTRTSTDNRHIFVLYFGDKIGDIILKFEKLGPLKYLD